MARATRYPTWPAVLLGVAVAGGALFVVPRSGLSGGSVGKATVVALCGLAAVVIASVVACRSARIVLPRHPALVAAGATAVLMLVRALAATDTARALVGPFTRWHGAVLYLACLALMFLAARHGTRGSTTRNVVRTLLVTGAIVSLLAIDEATLGLGPDWDTEIAVAGPLGNSNFLAGWVALLLPLAVVMAADPESPVGWRIHGGVTALLLALAGVFSMSLQAGYVAAGALGVLVIAWATTVVERRVAGVLVGSGLVAAVVAAGVTAIGVLGHGPLSMLRQQTGPRLRAEYWTAAGRMIGDHFWWGIGPGTFAQQYRGYRTPEVTRFVSADVVVDAPHNVPLQILTEWGVVVVLAYVATLALVGWAAVRELRARQGPARWRYAGLVAAWVGYVLQAAISIDVPVLAVTGWVLAGLVVAPQVRGVGERELPWRPRRKARSRRRTAWGAFVGSTVVVVLAAVVAWMVLAPLRAEFAWASSGIQVQGPEGSRTLTIPAGQIARWEVAYWRVAGHELRRDDQLGLAQEAFDRGLEIEPESVSVLVPSGRVAAAAGDDQLAEQRFRRALELEPHHPDLAVEVAQFALSQGQRDWAHELLDRALRVEPDHEQALRLRDEL